MKLPFRLTLVVLEYETVTLVRAQFSTSHHLCQILAPDALFYYFCISNQMLFISCTHSARGDLINTDIVTHAPHICVRNEFTLGLTMKLTLYNINIKNETNAHLYLI